MGDLNHDGNLDAVVTLPSKADSPNQQVRILLGDGHGNLQPASFFDTGLAPQGVAVQDLNWDGWPDLVVANSGTNTISVLINNHGGALAQVEYTVGSAPWAVAIADLNGDGKPDLAVTNSCGGDPTCKSVGSVSILLGNGDGTFQAQTTYDVGYNPQPIAAADFNGDHVPDLAVGNFNDNTVSILVGNGSGGFIQPHGPYASAPWEPYGVVAADFNGDGRVDLAVSNAGSDSVSILLGKGDATFQTHVDYWAGNGAGILAAGDFNGDSKIDLAVPDLGWNNRYDTRTTVLVGNGDGTFRSHVLYPTGDSPVAFAWGDFNDDGNLDLVVANEANGTVGIFLGNGDGTYQKQSTYPAGNNPSAVVAGDFNGDSSLDVAVTNSVDETVTILLGVGDGGGGLQLPLPPITVGATPVAIAAADLDKDGKLDLVVSNSGDSTVEVLLGNGDGSFRPQAPSPVGENPRAIAVGDANGDSKLDVVAVNSLDNTVSVLLGNGDGTLHLPASTYPVGNNPTAIVAADFGNGNLDLAVTNLGGSDPTCANSYTMSVLLGNGDGTFQDQTTYPTGCGPSAVTAGDFNGDGKLDLLVANEQANTASLFYGSGDGTFQGSVESPAPAYGLGWQPTALGALDLNGDEAVDMVSVNSGVRSISAVLNAQGTRLTFESSALNSTYGEPITLTSTVTASISWESAPTGSVSFLDGNSVLGTAPLGGGTAVFTTSELTAGSHTLAARYLGDSNFQPHTSSPVVVSVSQAATTTTLTSSPNPSDLGQLVTLTAMVATGASEVPTGTVTFLDGVTPIGTATLVNSVAIFTISTLEVGTHVITASYGGDANFIGSTSPEVNQVIYGPDFSLGTSALPGPLIVGQSGTSTTTVTSIHSFSAAVALTCSEGLPGGASCAFDPPSVTPAPDGTATSTLTLTTTSKSPAGNYTVTITGTSGSLSRNASLGLSLTDFTIDGPAFSTPSVITPGGSATATVELAALNGFANPVSLGCLGLPTGAACSFEPASVTPTVEGATSVLTISTSASTPTGAYTISLVATSGTLVRSYLMSFNIGDFEITVPLSTSPSSVRAGESATAVVTVSSIDGFANSVLLSCSELPSGVSCTFNPASASPTAQGTPSTLTVKSDAKTLVGIYTLSVTGTSEMLSHTYSTLSFGVGDFDASAPSSLNPSSISAGQSATAAILWKAHGGFADAVRLSCSVSPAPPLAPTCSLNPTSVIPSASGTPSTLTVNTHAAMASQILPTGHRDTRLFYGLWLPFSGMAFLGVGLLAERSRRRQLIGYLLVTLLAGGLLFQLACGGGSTSNGGGGTAGTPAGNYTVTVTGSSGTGANAVTHTASVTVTVK
ncbi:MAG: FG-GAP-like repeat-containing protein [Acidobacteriia bacterium]|nr:FG-GAP-like repeat-containing protein [Terriglobia bacterium]